MSLVDLGLVDLLGAMLHINTTIFFFIIVGPSFILFRPANLESVQCNISHRNVFLKIVSTTSWNNYSRNLCLYVMCCTFVFDKALFCASLLHMAHIRVCTNAMLRNRCSPHVHGEVCRRTCQSHSFMSPARQRILHDVSLAHRVPEPNTIQKFRYIVTNVLSNSCNDLIQSPLCCADVMPGI